jgi:DNA-binding Lrp family transcriptional regulator
MVTAFVLIKVRREALHTAAQQILDLEGMVEVYSVTGKWDLVAVARVRQSEQLAKLMTEDVVEVEGIVETNTMIAFRQYSEHDLEAMFGLGMA